MSLPGVMTIVHVVLGSVALAAVPLALAVRPGGRAHRRVGRLFVFAMLLVLFSAGFLWQAKGHVFLVPLGLISGYLLWIAMRAVTRRRGANGRAWAIADLIAACGCVAAAAGCMFLGGSGTTPLLREIAPALVGIGGVGASYALNEVLGMLEPRSRAGWLLTHLASMLAAYVSAVTAFIVINAHAVPMLLRWGVPAMLGGMAISWYALRTLGVRFTRSVVPATPLQAATTVASDGRAGLQTRPALDRGGDSWKSQPSRS